MGEELLEHVSKKVAENRSTITTVFEGNEHTSYSDVAYFYVMPSDKVPQGKAYVSTQLNNLASNGYCIGKKLDITCEDIYRTETLNLTIGTTYAKWNFKSLFGEEFVPESDGIV